MKPRVWAAAALPAALVALSGCVYDDFSYGGWSGSYGAVGVGYASPGFYRPYSYGPVYYDAFYDNFYGPIYGGYWHNDGFFYYQTYFGGPWYCDYGRHFRRDSFRGGARYRFEDHRVNNNSGAPILGRGTILDKIVESDNPGRGASQPSFQGDAGQAYSRQGGRGGQVRNGSIAGRVVGEGRLEGGPGGGSGQAPAAAPPSAQQISPLNAVRNTIGNSRGRNDNMRFQGGPSGQSERSSAPTSVPPPPRSSPPPAGVRSALKSQRGHGKRD